MSRKGSVELYMHKLKKHLTLPKKYRQSFLEGLTQEMQEHANEQAPCTYEHLADTFGEPELVARQFIEQSDSADLVRRTKQRRIILSVFMVALIILAIFLAVLVIIMALHTEVRVTEEITESYRQYEFLNFSKEC